MNRLSTYLLTGNHMAYMTAIFLGLAILTYGVFEAMRRHRRKIRHLPINGFKFTTKNIGYIAMMIAVSVSITVVISITLPVTVFPPVRIAFTGIMVKITGLFFGPIVGIIVGIISELLCLMFVPSYIHVAYFIVAIGFGFWAGITGFTKHLKGKSKWYTFGLINAYVIIFTIVMYWITSNNTDTNNSSFFGIQVAANIIPTVFISLMGAILLIIWIMTVVLELSKRGSWLEFIFPIILLCIVTETLCTLLLASWGDAGFLGIPSRANGYISMVITRLLMSPLKIIFNTVILSTVSVVLRPLIKNN